MRQLFRACGMCPSLSLLPLADAALEEYGRRSSQSGNLQILKLSEMELPRGNVAYAKVANPLWCHKHNGTTDRQERA